VLSASATPGSPSPITSALAGPARRLGFAQRLRFYFTGTPWDSAP
jgi:hypothetical protein